MQGVINVLKPSGMTSHDIIKRLRKLLNIKKIGHSGTLDPAATGVLPVFVGRATKAIEFFEKDDKEYIAEICFGITTSTADAEGEVVNIYPHPFEINREELEKILVEFIGEIEQIPPMYSAVHYKGKKLYELARQGVTVEREPRRVRIYSIKVMSVSSTSAVIEVICSKGTYIRTLCEDIGGKLGFGAHLLKLRRTRSGPFDIQNAFTLEQIEENIKNGTLEKVLLPVDKYLCNMPAVILEYPDDSFFIKGRLIHEDFSHLAKQEGKFVRVYNFEKFLGIAVVKSIEQQVVLQVYKSL